MHLVVRRACVRAHPHARLVAAHLTARPSTRPAAEARRHYATESDAPPEPPQRKLSVREQFELDNAENPEELAAFRALHEGDWQRKHDLLDVLEVQSDEQQFISGLHKDESRKRGWLQHLALPASWLHALESGSTKHLLGPERDKFLSFYNAATLPDFYNDAELPGGGLPKLFAEALQTGRFKMLNSHDRIAFHRIVNDLLLLGATLRDSPKVEVPAGVAAAVKIVQEAKDAGRIPPSLISAQRVGDPLGLADVRTRTARDVAVRRGTMEGVPDQDIESLAHSIERDEQRTVVTRQKALAIRMVNHSMAHGREYAALLDLREAILALPSEGPNAWMKPDQWVDKLAELAAAYRDLPREFMNPLSQLDEELTEQDDKPDSGGKGRKEREEVEVIEELVEGEEGDEDMSENGVRDRDDRWEPKDEYRLQRAFAASRGTPHLEDWPRAWQNSLWMEGEERAEQLRDKIVGVERELLLEAIDERLPMLEENAREQTAELEERLAPTPGSDSAQIRFLSDMHRLQQMFVPFARCLHFSNALAFAATVLLA